MKSFVKEFCKRGFVAAWGGPAVLAVIYAILGANGTLVSLSGAEAARGIFSSTLLAFIAAGMQAIYLQERLPLLLRTGIHAAALYLDYLLIYLFNGWLLPRHIGVFSVIFAAGFALIWLLIRLASGKKAAALNRGLTE